MPGWSHEKRLRTEAAFYSFLDRCFVNSRDAGQICLGKSLYDGQRRVITQIFDALENDIHDVYVLKSRQLGISTLFRALTVFWLGIHKGLRGAIVFDTDANRANARGDLETMINDLPKTLKFPAIKNNNRTGVRLANDSEMLFMSAGVRASKTSGTLGRSVGLSVAMCSEICSWDNPDGLEAFRQSLSDINPDRLYIYESTARGFNKWFEMWEDAKKDPHHCCTIFLGFWAKQSQCIEKDHPDFALYSEDLNEKERELTDLVKSRYGHDISIEQWAWYRRRMNPAATLDAADVDNDEYDPLRVQEQPVIEEESWQQTGSVFFPAKQLTEQTVNHIDDKFQKWMFLAGSEFTDMRIYKAPNIKMCDLKVWDDPDPDGSYIVSCDPAFGENPDNDRSAVQVFRCYGDGIDQAAEYASALINTRQLAWVIAALLGWYGGGNAQVRYVLELNGPGMAVFNAIKELKFQLDQGYFGATAEEKGLADLFRNVKTFIYTRPDGMSAGQNWHLKTNSGLKVMMMERLRDFVSNGAFRIRSSALIKEMATISREGDSISAPQSMRDDLTLASAFGVHYWETSVRKDLISRKITRASEEARKRLSIVDQVKLFNQNQLGLYFSQKASSRAQEQRMASNRRWRSR